MSVTNESLTEPVPFNKIRLGGMSADLEGYAYEVDRTGERPRAYLWYVSMLGHKAAVQAIWAGLVNSPPQNVVLSWEDGSAGGGDELSSQPTLASSIEPQIYREPTGTKPIMVGPVERGRSGGWNFFKAQLTTACAYQGVLVPQSAFTQPHPGQNRRPQKTETGTGREQGNGEFLILRPPTPAGRISTITNANNTGSAHVAGMSREIVLAELYYTRLNKLVDLPLHPAWANSLWQLAIENSEVNKLECAGVEAYLCRQPDEERLQTSLSDLLRLGKLSCP